MNQLITVHLIESLCQKRDQLLNAFEAQINAVRLCHQITSEIDDIIPTHADATYDYMSIVFMQFKDVLKESRPRVCVVAVSNGLPELELSKLKPPAKVTLTPLQQYLEYIPLDAPLWRTMDHIKRKVNEPALNFKNMLYTGCETLISCITATYAAHRVGAPMLLHPTNPDLQRQLTPKEHASIRQLPDSLEMAVMEFAYGNNPLVSKLGSASAVHRMLGNSVSKKVWVQIGSHLGHYLAGLINYALPLPLNQKI
ncbi:hypothetical protein [Shewanella inventionis]|nr:hypothetical protein [Shewanella inventionis]